MAVRLIDVARAANVSRSTASNVFTNPERVRPQLRAQVEAAAKTLGYAGPDPKARLLRAGKVNAVGVVVPGQWGVADTLRSPVFVQFLQGVAKACDKAGASIVLLPDAPGISGVASAVVDGFIFGRIGQMEQLQGARRRKLPFAVVDFNAGPEVNAVLIDAHAGAKAAVKHLLDLGHRRRRRDAHRADRRLGRRDPDRVRLPVVSLRLERRELHSRRRCDRLDVRPGEPGCGTHDARPRHGHELRRQRGRGQRADERRDRRDDAAASHTHDQPVDLGRPGRRSPPHRAHR